MWWRSWTHFSQAWVKLSWISLSNVRTIHVGLHNIDPVELTWELYHITMLHCVLRTMLLWVAGTTDLWDTPSYEAAICLYRESKYIPMIDITQWLRVILHVTAIQFTPGLHNNKDTPASIARFDLLSLATCDSVEKSRRVNTTVQRFEDKMCIAFDWRPPNCTMLETAIK